MSQLVAFILLPDTAPVALRLPVTATPVFVVLNLRFPVFVAVQYNLTAPPVSASNAL